jgi:hypothetical protein
MGGARLNCDPQGHVSAERPCGGRFGSFLIIGRRARPNPRDRRCSLILSKGKAAPTAQRAVALVNRGIAYYDRNELGKARANYTSVIQLDPKNAEAFRYRGGDSPPFGQEVLSWGGRGRVEGGAGLQHGAGDVEEAIGH